MIRPSRPGLEELEPRLLYAGDAALLLGAGPVVDVRPVGPTAAPATTAAAGGGTWLLAERRADDWDLAWASLQAERPDGGDPGLILLNEGDDPVGRVRDALRAGAPIGELRLSFAGGSDGRPGDGALAQALATALEAGTDFRWGVAVGEDGGWRLRVHGPVADAAPAAAVLRTELVVVDAALAGDDALREALGPVPDGTVRDWLVLDADRPGLEQVAQALAGRSGLAAVHVLAHGREGGLQLGGQWVDADAVAQARATVAAWGAALAPDADLLLYACDTGAGDAGGALLQALAEATGADVAASTDTTGAADRGGDWTLEATHGAVETAALSAAGWQGALALTPVGGEIRVNTSTLQSQNTPSVSMADDGRHVVVWQGRGPVDNDGIHAQLYDAAGNPVGGEFQVNTTTSGDQARPVVAMDAAGNFVVVWEDTNGADGSGFGVYAQRFDANGVRLGAEFRVNASTAGDQWAAGLAMDDAGHFVVVWHSNHAGGFDVYGQRYSAAGVPQGGEFRVNTTTADEQMFADVAMNGSGGFVVAWRSVGQDGDGMAVVARRYDAAGTALTGEIQVNQFTTGDQAMADVAIDDAGRFTVVWFSQLQDPGGNAGVYLRRFAPDGTPLGGESRVNSFTASAQDQPAIAMDPAGGGTIVVWQSDDQDGDAAGIYVQGFDADGDAEGPERRVSTTTLDDQQFPSVAWRGGTAVVVWSGTGAGDADGVFLQRFAGVGPPRNTVPGPITVAEDTTIAVTGVSASDGDDDLQRVRLSVGFGQLTMNLAGGATVVDGANGTGVVEVAGSAAQIQAALASLQFRGDANRHGGDTLTITSTDAGNRTATDTVAITVTPVNDAPVLDAAGTMTFTPVTEDDRANAGQTVASLIASAGGDRITDADTGAPEGIAVTDVSAAGWTGSGRFEYSLDGGATWRILEPPSNTGADLGLLLRNTDRVRWVPNGFGAETATLTFRAWDRSTGTAGALASVAVTGGASAFSTAAETVSITTTAVNDAPRFGSPPGVSASTVGVLGAQSRFYDTVVLADGRVLAVGTAQVGGSPRSVVVRLLADGSLDPGFGAGGTAVLPSAAYLSMGVQADGRIVVGGASVDSLVAMRLSADGQIDTGFGSGGVAIVPVGALVATDAYFGGFAVQADGRILVAGASWSLASSYIARFTADGAVDTGFGSGGLLTLQLGGTNTDVMAITSWNNQLVATGTRPQAGDVFVARFTESGALDTTFNGTGWAARSLGGTASQSAHAVAVAPDGSVVIAGTRVLSGPFRASWAVARFTASGSADAGFGTGGLSVVRPGVGDAFYEQVVRAVAIEPDGQLVLAGTTDTGQGKWKWALMRLNADGSLDTGFADGGTFFDPIVGRDWDVPYAVAVAPNGDIVSAGEATYGAIVGTVLRLDATGRPVAGPFSGRLDGAPAFIEGGAPVVLDADVQLFDEEGTTAGTFQGASLTLARQGGADALDRFGFDGVVVTRAGADLSVSGVRVGTVTEGGGTLRVDFDGAGATPLRVEAVLRGIRYWHAGGAPPASVPIAWTFDDGNTGAQGAGGARQATGTTTVTITSVNDPTTVTAPSGAYTPVDTPLAFGTAAGRVLSVADPDAAALTVTLSTTAGTLTLAGTAGLTFTTGTGTADAAMTFTGSVADINAALDGAVLTPAAGWRGLATVGLATDNGAGSVVSRSVAVHVGAIVVTNAGDTADGDTSSIAALAASDGGDGVSLREAILAANATANAGGPDRILFAIPGTGVHTITLASALPAITEAVVIDASGDDSVAALGGRPAVVLDGGGVVARGLGLYAGSDGSTVRGLVLQRFASAGIDIVGSGGHLIAGNWIGLTADGTAAAGNGIGINVFDSTGVTLGGTADADRNVVSGNLAQGIRLVGTGGGHVVVGNRIGTNVAGTAAVGNGSQGVLVMTADNVIGGAAPGARNLVSGNGDAGLMLTGAGAVRNVVAGNWIGLNVTGTADLDGAMTVRPFRSGVALTDGAADNRIGTDADGVDDAAERNVISGNDWDGVVLADAATARNVVQGNWIGTNAAGTAAIGNAASAVSLWGSRDNRIGSGLPGAGNVIAGSGTGVAIGAGAADNRVQGNLIGLGPDGLTVLGNTGSGVVVYDGGFGTPVTGNVIGTDADGVRDAAEGNTIAGNVAHGIAMAGAPVTGNIVAGNRIGTDATGTGARANGLAGVLVDGAAGNRIGGTAVAERNVIAFNGGAGVLITGAGATGTRVEGNFIGVRANGQSGGNGTAGVRIAAGASDSRIGGTAAGAGNLVFANTTDGVALAADAGSGHAILGNRIVLNNAEGIDLGEDGITTNDAGDADGGPNGRQNVPVLTRADIVDGGTRIAGSLGSSPSTAYRLEFFSNWPNRVDATHGEGNRFLGALTVTTDAAGQVAFDTTLSARPVNPGEWITATATVDLGGGTYGSTSEFAANILAGAGPRVDLDGPATPAPAGADRPVAGTTTGEQTTAGSARAVAVDPAGRSVVVWSGRGADDTDGVFARRFAADGTPLGGEFRVNATVAGVQSAPSVAVDASGAFVVVWQGAGPGDAGGIFGQRFDASGVPVGGEFRIHTTDGAGAEVAPAVAMNANGNFVVAWTNSASGNVYAQRFHATGFPTNAELLVATGTGPVAEPGVAVAIDDSSRIVVVWAGGTGADADGIHLRRYDLNGAPIAGPEGVNTTTAGVQSAPAIGMRPDGRFVVAWTAPGQDAAGDAVFARRYDAAGVALGGEFRVNTVQAGDQGRPSVAALPGGDFVVTWVSDAGGDADVRGQRLAADGTPLGDEFGVVAAPAGAQDAASVAAGGGVVAVVWRGADADGSGVFLQSVPTADPTGQAANFVEGGGPVALAEPDALVTDADGTVLASLVLRLVGQPDGLAEVLAANPTGTGLSVAWNGVAGTLTISGTDTVAAYRQVLRTVTYVNTAGEPTPGNRSVLVTASDGTHAGDAAIATVQVVAVNDAPTLTAPTGAYTPRDTPLAFDVAGNRAITVTDADGDPLTVTLSATQGAHLTLATLAGLAFTTGDGTADATMTFTGTASAVNAALDGLTLAPAAGFRGLATLALRAEDPSGAAVERTVAAHVGAIVVTTVADTVNGATGGGIAALAADDGGDGVSLREAILAANATVGADPVHLLFAIPGTGVHTITPTVALPSVARPVVIDATSDDSFGAQGGRPAVQLRDPTGTLGVGLALVSGSSGSTVRGLIVSGFAGSGLLLFESGGHRIAGNWLGLTADGTAADGNVVGLSVGGGGATGSVIGGTTVADRNVISGNRVDGVQVSGGGDANTFIGNLVGLDPTGTVAVGNTFQGFAVFGGTGNVFGGTAPGAANVVSGNGSEGFRFIEPSTTGNVVVGNRIGTDAGGTVAVGNASAGVAAWNGASGNRVGGTAPGEGNLIAHQGGAGVAVRGAGTQLAVLGNVIRANGGLGIDLAGDGVSPNDPDDADTGPNDLQNTPLVLASVVNGGTATITGELRTTPSTAVRIEVFASPAGTEDASGHGEAALFLGAVETTTDATGFVAWSLPVAGGVAPDDRVTATTTRVLGPGVFGATSEFAMNVVAQTAPVVTVPGPRTVAEDTALAIPGVSADDADGDLQQVALAVDRGTLALDLSGGATVLQGATGTGRVTLGGSSAQIGAALATLQYRGVPDFAGADTLTVTATDAGGRTDTDTVAITVTAVNDAPRLTLGAANLVTNGSFEGSAAGWTGSPAVEVSNDTFAFGTTPPPAGGWWVEVEGAGATAPAASWIEQTIATEAGRTYDLALWAATRTQTFGASANTGDLGAVVVDGVEIGRIATGAAWSAHGFTFTATSASTTIRIVSLGSVSGTNAGPGDGAGLLVDDMRVVARDNQAAWTEGAAPVVLAPSLRVADPDLGGAGAYAGTTVSIARQGGANALDLFSATGTLDPLNEGGALRVGGSTIGTVVQNSAGRLVLTIGGAATAADVEAALRQIAWSHAGDGPPPSVTLAWTADDGNTGGQGTGGALQAIATTTVAITAVNDPPVIPVTDVALDERFDAGLAGWTPTGVVTPSGGAVRLGGGTVGAEHTLSRTFATQVGVRYTLSLDYTDLAGGGSTYLSVQAGTNGTGLLAGHSGVLMTFDAVSTVTTVTLTAAAFASVPVDALVDNVTISGTGQALDPMTEDDGPTAGTTVAAIVARFGGDLITDPDPGAVEGIAVVGLSNLRGNWEYSLDGGAVWSPLVFADDSIALLLRDTDRVRFVPGGIDASTPSLFFRAWDRTVGSAGDVVAITAPGEGASPFSRTVASAVIEVTAVNDAPVFVNLDGTPTFTEGGAPVVLDADVVVQDDDLRDYTGSTLVLQRDGGADAQDVFVATGTLEPLATGATLVVDGTAIGTVTENGGGRLVLAFDANASFLRVAAAMRQIAYAHGGDAPPAGVTIRWTFDDGNTGAQGTGGALQATGTTTVTITAVDDPTTVAAPTGAYTPVDTPLAFGTAAGRVLAVADPDAAALTVTLSTTAGTLTLAGTAGLTFMSGTGTADATMTFTGTVADIDAALDGAVLTPAAGWRGLATVGLVADDGAGTVVSRSVAVHVGAIVVSNASDVANGTVTGLAALAADDGGDGVSLREAILAANATANAGGPDRILFAIPGLQVHTIAPTAALPAITDAVVLDARTDDSFANNGNRPAVVLDGNDLAADGLVLTATADGSTIRGLVIRDFGGAGIRTLAGSDGHTLAGNHVGRLAPDGSDAGAGEGNTRGLRIGGSNTLIGGTAAADRNVVSGNQSAGIVVEDGALGNTIAGNLVGTDATGTVAVGNGGHGIEVRGGASGLVIGGTAAGAGNLVSGNAGDGIQVVASARITGLVIQGNRVGTDVTGTLALGNARGIGIDQADDALIGGSVAGARNVIAGNLNAGVWASDSSGLVLHGSHIGVDATGQARLANGATAIDLWSTGTTAIGGAAAGEGNVIAGDVWIQSPGGDPGVTVEGNRFGLAAGTDTVLGTGALTVDVRDPVRIGGTTPGAGNRFAGAAGAAVVVRDLAGGPSVASLLGNTFTGGVGLAIDLGGDGVTANDAGDVDTGPNAGQNFPVLGWATSSGGETRVTGTLDATALRSFRIELFASPAGDPSGHGPGSSLLGALTATTDASGRAAFDARLAGVSVPAGWVVTATATEDLGGGAHGATSEFAANVLVAAPPGVTVTPLDTSTTEAGDTGAFTVVLDRAPTADVTLAVSVSRPGEATASTALLTFTATNWNVAQTVTVTGVDDTLDDGDRAFRVILGPAASADPAYDGLAAVEVAMVNADDDDRSTVVVTTAADVADGDTSSLWALWNDRGADGEISLREAIAAANATANGAGGADRITFAIPGTGVHTITLVGALPSITDAVVLDASTDDSAAALGGRPAVVIDGGGSVSRILTLAAGAGGSTVRGLVLQGYTDEGLVAAGSGGHTIAGNWIGLTADGVGAAAGQWGITLFNSNDNRIGGPALADRNVVSGHSRAGIAVHTDDGTSTGNRIEGNWIGTDATGTREVGNRHQGIWVNGADTVVGGAAPGQGNVIAGTTAGFGIQVTAVASGTRILGNRIGTDPGGTVAMGHALDGIHVAASGVTIGGTAPGEGNVVSGNARNGLTLIGAGATGAVVAGNRIGTTADGLAALGNGDAGVALVDGAAGNRIGGTTTGAGNTVAGNGVRGVLVSGTGTFGNAIEGNRIGVLDDGVTRVGNGWEGIAIAAGATGSRVGGTVTAAANRIEGHAGPGILLAADAGADHALLGNRIVGNGGLGIDLGGDGVTAADPLDADGGPNDGQNAPVVTGVTTDGPSFTASGALQARPGTVYRIELFAVSAADADPSGHGEAAVRIDAFDVTTDAAGLASWSRVAIPVALAAGDRVTATATAPAAGGGLGSTSEFAANAAVQASTGLALTVPGPQALVEDVARALPGVSVAGLDGGLGTVALAVGRGTLAIDPAGGATVVAGGLDTAALTLRGTVAQLDAALATLVYRGLPDTAGPDVLDVVLVDAGGRRTAGTVDLAVAPADDAPTGAPTVAGPPVQGATLVADTSTIADVDGLGAFAFQWLRDGVPIDGATTMGHVLGQADVGRRLSVVASYVDGQGHVTRLESAAVGPVADVDDAVTGRPVIDGVARVGRTLVADTGAIADADGVGVIALQWLRDGVAIDGATGTTYLPTAADVGRTLTVAADVVDGAGRIARVTAAPVGPVGSPPSHRLPVAPTTAEDTPLAIAGLGVDDADGDLATTRVSVDRGTLSVRPVGGAWIAAGADGGASLTLAGGVAAIDATLATLRWQPPADGNGTALLTVASTDATGDTTVDTVALTITPVDDAPVLASHDGRAAVALDLPENTAGPFTAVRATDVDSPVLIYRIVGGADADRFVVDASTGALSFVRAPDHERPGDADGDGVWQVAVAASDGTGSVVQALSITVRDVDEAPVVTRALVDAPRGGVQVLDGSMLSAQDDETPAARLAFEVVAVRDGWFAAAQDPGQPVTRFLQSDVTQGRIVFVHAGATASPQAELVASDGVQRGASVTLVVRLTDPPVAAPPPDTPRPAPAPAPSPPSPPPSIGDGPPAPAPDRTAPPGDGEPGEGRTEPPAEGPVPVPEWLQPPVAASAPAMPLVPGWTGAADGVGAGASGAAAGERATAGDPAGLSAARAAEAAGALSSLASVDLLGLLGPAGGVDGGVDRSIGGLAVATTAVGGGRSRLEAAPATALGTDGDAVGIAGLRLEIDAVSQIGGMALSAGAVLWVLRAGGVVAGLMAGVPAWQRIDPLPVLGGRRGRDGDDRAATPIDEADRRAERVLMPGDGT